MENEIGRAIYSMKSVSLQVQKQFVNKEPFYAIYLNRKENNLWPSYDCRYILVKKVMSSSPHYLLTLCTRRWGRLHGETGKMRASVELLLYWLSFSFTFNLQALLDLLFLSFLSQGDRWPKAKNRKENNLWPSYDCRLGGDPMLGEDLEWRWEPLVISSVFIFTTIGSPLTTVKHLGFPYLYYLYFEESKKRSVVTFIPLITIGWGIHRRSHPSSNYFWSGDRLFLNLQRVRDSLRHKEFLFWLTVWGYQRNRHAVDEDRFPRAVSFLLSSGLRTRSWQLISIPHFFLNAVNFPQTNTNDESGWTIQRNLPKSRSHTTVGIIIMLGSENIDGWIFISIFLFIFHPSIDPSIYPPKKRWSKSYLFFPFLWIWIWILPSLESCSRPYSRKGKKVRTWTGFPFVLSEEEMVNAYLEKRENKYLALTISK